MRRAIFLSLLILPAFVVRANDWDWNDRARDRQVYDYYNEPLWY